MYMAYKSFLSAVLIGTISLGGFSASIRAAETKVIQTKTQEASRRHYYIYFNNTIDEKAIKEAGGRVIQKLNKLKAVHAVLTPVQVRKLEESKAVKEIKLDKQFAEKLNNFFVKAKTVEDQTIPKRYNIIFKNKTDLKTIERLQGEVEGISAAVKVVTAYLTPQAARVLKQNPNVKMVAEDRIVKIKGQVNDWGIAKTRTPKAWEKSYTGKGIKVAVIDTGIAAHSDIKVVGGKSIVEYTSSYKDDNGHGTHVAGIIAAQNNTQGVVGVANEAQLYAVKVLDDTGYGDLSDIIQGIDWAVQNGMHVINMSLGIEAPEDPYQQKIADMDLQPLKLAVDNAWNHGIFVVAAAGNESSENKRAPVGYPARFPNAIAVSAIDSDNGLSWFSNAGTQIDFAAPGSDINSTFLNNTYTAYSGTSMASAYVSGIIALYKQAYPRSSSSQILELMKENARDLGKAGKDNLFGYGLSWAPIGTPPAPKLQNKGYVNKGVKLRWNGVEKAKSYVLKRNGTVIYQGIGLEYIDTKYNINQVNKYEIRAVNSTGSSTAVEKSTYLLKAYIPTIAKVNHSISKNNIYYKWSKQSNTNYYVVYNKKTYSLGTKNNFTMYSVKQGKTYSIVVYAQNIFGKSKLFNKTITVPYTKPVMPSVSSVKASRKQVTLTWKPVSNAKYYIVKKESTVIYKGTVPKVIDKKIKKNKTYRYTIYAVNPKGTSKGKSVKVKVPRK